MTKRPTDAADRHAQAPVPDFADSATSDASTAVPEVSAKVPRDRRGREIKPLSTKANMLWNSAGSLLCLACQWLTTIFVVRLTTGYDAAGLLSLAMGVVGIFGTFANYKMGTYQVSDIHRENELGEYLGFRCLTLGLSFAACMVYAWLTCPAYTLATIALFYGYKAVGLVIDILHGLDQQMRRLDYIGKSFMLQGVATLAAFVIVFGLTQDLNGAIVAMAAAAAAVLVLFDIPHTAAFEPVRLKLSAAKARYFLKRSFPAVMASLAASAIFVIPKQYLLAVSGDGALGIYSSVAAPALIIQMGAVYLYSPFLDIFPRLYFDGDRKGFIGLLVKTSLGIIAVSVVCIAVLELIGAWVLVLLYGPSIADYVYLLQPAIITTSITMFLWFFGDLLITLRNFKGNLIGNLVAFAAVIPLSFLCVDRWDMNGVSFACIGATAAGVAVLLVFLLRRIAELKDASE